MKKSQILQEYFIILIWNYDKVLNIIQDMFDSANNQDTELQADSTILNTQKHPNPPSIPEDPQKQENIQSSLEKDKKIFSKEQTEEISNNLKNMDGSEKPVKSKEALQNLQKQIGLSKIQGDYMLKEKAKQIFNKQTTNNITLSEEEKKQLFDQCFNQKLKRIEKTTNLGDEIMRLYQKIYDDYLFQLRQQSNSQRGLPKRQVWIGDQKCEVNQMVMILKQGLIDAQIKSYKDLLIPTNKIHTNILKGEKTDATLEYFNMNDYFKVEQIFQYYGLNSYELNSCLKKEILRNRYETIMDNELNKINTKDKLGDIWNQINSSLSQIGIQFTDFHTFKQLAQAYQKRNIFSRFINFIIGPKQQIAFKFIKMDDKHSISNKDNTHHDQQFNERNKQKSYNYKQKSYNDKQRNISLGRFIIPQIQKSCNNDTYIENILQYTKSHHPQQYLRLSFYEHINWRLISQEVRKEFNYKQIERQVAEKLTEEFNHDIKQLNLKVVSYIDWKEILSQNSPQNYKTIQFRTINQDNEVQSTEKYLTKVQFSQFLAGKQLKKKLNKIIKSQISKYSLPLFRIKTKKLQPNQKNTYFKHYLTENKLTINELKKTEVKKFIFNELCNNKKSLDKFYFNIFRTVQSVIKSQIKKVEKNTLKQIYNKVSQEICKFNNDLNQISCNLHQKYIGYINLAVVYMIWKLIIDQKIKEKREREIFQAKQSQYQNEWQLFKARTSTHEQNNVLGDINQFIKQFKNVVNEFIGKTKLNYITLQKKQFSRQNTRQKIQTLIDMRIFRHETNPEEILAYLENPYDAVLDKYNSCYEESWKNLSWKYSQQSIGRDILEEFYQLLKRLTELFQEMELDDSKKMFSDFFEILEHQEKNIHDQISQNSYEQQGKRVFFQYFIDILLGQDPEKSRNCAQVQVKPIKTINIMMKSSSELRGVLTELKSIKYLSLTNLIKFVKKLLTSEIRSKFQDEIYKISQLTAKDKHQFINNIRVIVCNQKCPCCGRICGIENKHQFHKCLYGHQMRGLNSTYIQRQNNVREASVIRCQNMAQTDLIKYNGKQYTWIEFKQYWKDKKLGGWLFDDATLKINQSQLRFEQAWTIAGPIYCDKNGLKFVPFNKAEGQLNEQRLAPIHYIFALDQSTTMRGTRWQNLLKSLNQTVQKIKAKDNNRNMLKISIIKFDSSTQLVCENYNPSQVNPNLSFKGGWTDFDPPFNEAARIARKYIDNSKIVFIFMTDGDASYPMNGVQALKSLQMTHPNKLHYSGIQFNSSQQVMKLISSQLKGKSVEAYNPEMLTTLFKRSIQTIIQIIEFKQGK